MAARRAVAASDGQLPAAVRDDVLLGGWGLVLVERIAARWGVGHGASGTRVWFEVEFGC
jgi:hypothetical protein